MDAGCKSVCGNGKLENVNVKKYKVKITNVKEEGF